jgi:hypothetical protein
LAGSEAVVATLAAAQVMIARLEALPGGDRQRALTAARKAVELGGDDPLQTAQAHVVLGNLSEDDPQARRAEYDKAVELATFLNRHGHSNLYVLCGSAWKGGYPSEVLVCPKSHALEHGLGYEDVTIPTTHFEPEGAFVGNDGGY